MPEHVIHTIDPYYNPDSRVLILGSIPSPKSREGGFPYAHPQNRFWKVLAAITDEAVPGTVEEKKMLLKKHKIALWDVLKSCDIEGASDSTIKNPVANDISIILDAAPIEAVFTTGGKATALYKKLIYPKVGMQTVGLPSTSAANAAKRLPDLVEAYSVIRDYVK